MVHAQLTESVRELVGRTFARLGITGGPARETILIRDGSYCGRRFDAAEGHAVWLVEKSRVQFYAADGSLLCEVAAGLSEPAPQRAAA